MRFSRSNAIKATFAWALAPVAATLFLHGEARADDYGCRVLMCLSNPNGPMQAQGCQPPIQRFLMEQAQKPPKSFPTCEEAQGAADVRRGVNPYDECPAGTTALASGAEVLNGIPKQRSPQQRPIGTQPGLMTVVNPDDSMKLYLGIGDGAGMTQGRGKKVCVGKPLGQVRLVYTNGSLDTETTKTVEAYESVVTMDPHNGSAQYYDVFINDQLYRRNRF